MNDTRTTRLLCSRRSPHAVGRVVATPAGYEVRFVSAVRTREGHTGREAVWTEADAAEGALAWCQVCRKVLHLPLSGAVAAARDGRKALVLFTEAMGNDPLGVSSRAKRYRA